MRKYILISLLSVVFVISVLVSMSGIFKEFSITGMITGTASVEVSESTTISMPVQTVAFPSLNPGQTDNTTDFIPTPFLVQNDGNVYINLTISVDSLDDLWTSVSSPSNFFHFNVTENETGSVVDGSKDINVNSSFSSRFVQMPLSTNPTWLANRTKFAAASDALNVHINVTVPSDEQAGAKSSGVIITATKACATATCT